MCSPLEARARMTPSHARQGRRRDNPWRFLDVSTTFDPQGECHE